MSNSNKKTLRLLMPQWQGGDNPLYHLGAEMLNWLAPNNDDPLEYIEVDKPDGNKNLKIEDGIVAKKALLKQLEASYAAIEKHTPDNIVMFGGDCLVDLAPFAYLNKKYEGDLAIIWIDSHPDIITPDYYKNAHAMVLGNLMGYGDNDFTKTVEKKVKPKDVIYVGVGEEELMQYERDFIVNNSIRLAGPKEMENGSSPVIDWLKDNGANNVAIHFDIDSLNPKYFRSQLFANPNSGGEHDAADMATGGMTMQQVISLMNDVQSVASIVGLGIAEHLPWEARIMQEALNEMPLIGK